MNLRALALIAKLAIREWRAVLLAGTAGAATIGAAVGLLGTGAWLIATAALQPAIAEIQVAVVGVRFFGIMRAVMRYLERLVAHDATFRLLSRARIWFVETLVPLAPARLVERRSGDLVARGISDVQALEPLVVRFLGPVVAAVLVGATTTAFLAIVADRVAALFLMGFVLLGVVAPLLLQLRRGRRRTSRAARRAAHSAALVDYCQGMSDLVAFGAEATQRQRVLDRARTVRRAKRREADLDALASGVAVILTHGTGLAVVLLAIPAVRAGNLDPVMLGVLGLVAVASFEAVSGLPAAVRDLDHQLQSAERLAEIAELQPAVEDSPRTAGTVGVSAPTIRFEGVRFTHRGALRPTLEEIDLELAAGENVAIVGATGCGKTTLAALLARVWDPEHGRILVDGIDIRELPMEAHRRRLGVVTQRPFLFSGTVAENLRLVARDADEAELDLALDAAGLSKAVAEWPAGLQTPVGEHGRRLSGGEQQRLAVARALLVKPQIAILDEVTSALDPATARRMLDGIDRTLVGSTRLYVTHRLVDMSRYDRVIVMQNGRISQTGRHEELAAERGVYRDLLARQAGRLRG